MPVLSHVDIGEAVRSIERDGYAIFRGAVSKPRLAQLADDLRREFEAARSSGRLPAGGGAISGHLNCFPGEQTRFVYDEVESHGLIDVVRALDPIGVDTVRVTTNYNMPGSAPQHYHMDGLFTNAFLICNVAVVDTDLSNGALDVLPGTNREYYKFWRYALERKHRLSTRLEMEQGDAVIRISTLWHRGTANFTDTPRPLMSLTFGEKGAPTGDPFLNNDGQVVFYPNWYSPSRLGRIRERTFVAAPWTYSALRFARSLVGNKGYSSW